MAPKMVPCAFIGEAAIYADTKPNKHDFPLVRCAYSCSDPGPVWTAHRALGQCGTGGVGLEVALWPAPAPLWHA